MLQDNPLLAQLKQKLHQQTPRTEGVIKAHEKGYGFLETDNKKSYFIPVNKMKKVMGGDRVSGILIPNNDKQTFEPEQLITPYLQQFIGQIQIDNNIITITPENIIGKYTIGCKVNPLVDQKLKTGDWVKAQLITHPLQEGQNRFLAEITRYIASNDSHTLLWQKALAKHNLEESAPSYDCHSPIDHDAKYRSDLTDFDFFTIDSDTTADMDDAIYLTQTSNNDFVIYIAIADPTAYIELDSPLDKEIQKRCFSTYLPNFTVPMLPEQLATDLCSLCANEIRPAVVCQITIDQQGNAITPPIFRLTYIKSKAKLSYQNVSDFLENRAELKIEAGTSIPEQLQQLKVLMEIRTNWRKTHALLSKDHIEYRFIFDNNNHLTNITQEPKRIAHKMIEEAMIIANLALAEQLQKSVGFGIFNTHNGFDSKYADTILSLLKTNNIEGVNKESLLSFEGYKQLRRDIENDPFIEYRLKGYQTFASLSNEPSPHFAMGFAAYSTWTSPIRKYGDMVNHRIIKALLCNYQAKKPEQQLFDTINERRKQLRLVEKEITEKLYIQFLTKNQIESPFHAQIININRGGARVRLLEIGAIAFLPLSLIHIAREEITAYPEEGMIKIKGEPAFKLIDTITVTINEVKTETSSIIVKYQPISAEKLN